MKIIISVVLLFVLFLSVSFASNFKKFVISGGTTEKDFRTVFLILTDKGCFDVKKIPFKDLKLKDVFILQEPFQGEFAKSGSDNIYFEAASDAYVIEDTTSIRVIEAFPYELDARLCDKRNLR